MKSREHRLPENPPKDGDKEKVSTTPVNKTYANKRKERAADQRSDDTDQVIGSEEPENPTDR